MCSYNAVDGVPACASRELLGDTLRGAWAFDGYVTGDCDAVADIYKTHNYTDDLEVRRGASRLA